MDCRRIASSIAVVALSVGSFVSLPAAAQEAWPSKLIRFVLPFSAGSGQDILARRVSPRLAERLGQPVIVDNKAGAGGIIGFDYIAKAAPDGYQIMMGNNSLLILSAIRPTTYDPLKDFAPVTLMGTGYSMVMVNASVPVNSVAELVAYSKSHPGQLNYASAAVGTFGHLGTELFKMQTGADFTHIPHKGIVAAAQGLVAGDVQVLIAAADLILPQVRAGKVRVLATAGTRRAPIMPDVPSTLDLGYKDYDTQIWYGLLVPAGTRRDVVARWNTEMSRTLAEPPIREDLLRRSIEPTTGTPEEFGELMKKEMTTWQHVIRVGNIKPE